MKLFLTAVFDEEFRKQVRELILDQARAIGRELVNDAVRAEIARKVQSIAENVTRYDPALRQQVQSAIATILSSRWNEIAVKVDDYLEKAATALIAKKLADKTVWEAKGQEDYVRKVVREELKRMLKE